MRTAHLIAALVGLVAVGIFAADASAHYHPRLGRFIQRDPGPNGGPARVGAGGSAAVGGFLPRDPSGSNQYADGMNLYQYAKSNPGVAVDPMGTKCCLKKVRFRYSDKPELEQLKNLNGDGITSFESPDGEGRRYLWKLSQYVEIKAYLTPDSDPKDCVMRQKVLKLQSRMSTKNTRVPGFDTPTLDYKPDVPTQGGKPKGGVDWDLVVYGKDWVIWWDTPGAQFSSEVDFNKVQKFDFLIWYDFKTAIHDKSANDVVRWDSNWTSTIWGELHIQNTKAVKEDYKGLTALFESNSYQDPPVQTEEVVMKR